MIILEEDYKFLEKDLTDYLRLFFGSAERDFRIGIEVPRESLTGQISASAEQVVVKVEALDGTAKISANSDGKILDTEVPHFGSAQGSDCERFVFSAEGYFAKNRLRRRRVVKRCSMAALYRFLKARTGKNFPYGAFTGIRPTKQYYTIVDEGIDPDSFFLDFLDFAPEKYRLVQEIVKSQRPYYDRNPKNLDVYVGIPFCKGRCNYCSFVSCDITKSGEWEEPYVDALLKEIEIGLDFARTGGWKIRSLYIGGGTPSSISKRNIERILSAVSRVGAPEFSFEAGRPDSIDRELLELLKRFGVNRISINPQSANDETLRAIGRRHTFAEVVSAFKLAKEFDFLLNADLIMGLAEERAEDFARTLEEVIALDPDNITVHSLSLKRGSKLRELEDLHHCEDIGRMSRISDEKLSEAGYAPYYMYRQKYSVGNLENSGYTRPGRECVYNIDNMEEIASVLAFGANAISKIVYPGEDRIERLASPKDIPTYTAKVLKIAEEKRIFEAVGSEEEKRIFEAVGNEEEKRIFSEEKS